MDFTNISYQGKTDLSILGSNGTFDDFNISIRDFDFSVFAEICDVNREKLEVYIVPQIHGQNGLFEIKEKYFNAIQEAICDYVNENDERWRDSAQDWADYYAELEADERRLNR